MLNPYIVLQKNECHQTLSLNMHGQSVKSYVLELKIVSKVSITR